ncbi:hypothetical protein EGR_10665 [Echinococcus granulosus]|uniref:Uncharacterized protein n=1 Tax=Echinococcus granulosus TaxID=6210 RepID=W6U1S7_ECHGR|nr:hypothetical protein EGR_10665 [Echinococcus granulosus]EUB54481.1 hypothetical protein EGR_10665 [Echinococcus granulosus]
MAHARMQSTLQKKVTWLWRHRCLFIDFSKEKVKFKLNLQYLEPSKLVT